MKFLLSTCILFISLNGLAQSQSTHYKSSVRGHFTHGSTTLTGKTENTTINIWTEGGLQESSYATNTPFISVASPTLSVPNGPSRNNSVLLFPNPVSDVLHIFAMENTSIQKVEIHSVSGSLLYQNVLTLNSSIHNSVVLNFSLFRPGIYFVNVYTSSGLVNKRIIKP